MLRIALGLLIIGSIAQPASPAAPMCALLDPEKSEFLPKLDAKLGADPAAKWVERAQVNKTLQEYKLQSAYGPTGLGERMRLGRALKADVLILLRSVRVTRESSIEVVVSEVATGLRLLVRVVPATGDIDDDSAAITAVIAEGLKRYAEPIQDIVAVYPFATADTDVAQERFKGVYAKLVEAEALRHPGTVVVEAAEAEAFVKEAVLSKTKRPSPLLLGGEFHHDGVGKERKLNFKLRAERGSRLVAPVALVKVAPTEGVEAVQKWAVETLDKFGMDKSAKLAGDKKGDALLLAERAQTLQKLGQFEAATSLYEAALISDPSKIEYRVELMMTIGRTLRKTAASATDPKQVMTNLRLYQLGLEHLEAFIAGGGDPSKYSTKRNAFVSVFRNDGNGLRLPPGNAAPALRKLFEDAQANERAVFLRLLGQPTVMACTPEVQKQFAAPAIANLPVAEAHKIAAKLLADLPVGDASANRARVLSEAAFWATEEGKPHAIGASYLAFKAKVTGAGYREADVSKEEFERLETIVAEREVAKKGRAAEADVAGVKFVPIKLTVEGTVASPAEPQKRIVGLMPVSAMVDIVWDDANVFIMKKKGVLTPVRLPSAFVGGLSRPVYDGKYVWIAGLVNGRQHTLNIFDPVSGKAWDLSKMDGLPPATADDEKNRRNVVPYAIAPLGPNRVFILGQFARTWGGSATFDPVKKSSMKVSFEAREVADPKDFEQWKSTGLAFTPVSALTLKGKIDDKPVARILVGRENRNTPFVDEHPLLLDPETGAAAVVESTLLGFPRSSGGEIATIVLDELYYVESRTGRDSRLLRCTLPGPESTPICDKIPEAVKAIHHAAGRFHFVEGHRPVVGAAAGSLRSRPYSTWWILDDGGETPELVGAPLQNVQGVAASAHHGLVAIAQTSDRDPRFSLFSVEFARDKKPK